MIEGKTWVFHEVPKTASTSIREALMPHSTKHLGQHVLPEEVGQRAPRDKIVACTVRNTYARAVSAWTHVTKMRTGKLSFEEWLRSLENRTKDRIFYRFQLYWARHCNFILRYEDLYYDFATFCEEAGLPRITLPVRNVGKYAGSRDYSEYYSPEAYDLVEKIWYQDIEYFKHVPPW